MKNELEALASELPILTDKSSYKYLSEVAGNGKYIQVAWQHMRPLRPGFPDRLVVDL